MRFRTLFLGIGSLFVLLALLASDPDQGLLKQLPVGGPLLAWMLSNSRGLIVVALAHLCWKALHDYDESDGRFLYREARAGNTAAGLALIARAVVMVGLFMVFAGPATAQVPDRAREHLPTLAAQLDEHWPTIPMRHYVAGLIEHESCITLRHPRCWSPTSRLKSAREEGAGLGQITRAYRPDGSLRFDALAEMRARHPALAGLTWETVYSRPDLQMRAVVLKVRGDFNALSAVRDPWQRLAMADAAYNGGLGGVHNERRACSLRFGCDPQRWWGDVEKVCLKSRAPLYGNRSACDINRHHVHDVMHVRAPKYVGLV